MVSWELVRMVKTNFRQPVVISQFAPTAPAQRVSFTNLKSSIFGHLVLELWKYISILIQLYKIKLWVFFLITCLIDANILHRDRMINRIKHIMMRQQFVRVEMIYFYLTPITAAVTVMDIIPSSGFEVKKILLWAYTIHFNDIHFKNHNFDNQF